MPAGSNCSRSTPLLGLAFLISAITAGKPAAIFRRRAPAKSRGAPVPSARRRIAVASTLVFAFAISSALTARIFSRMSATCELLGEFHERFELCSRRAALDQLEGLLHAVLKAWRATGDVDRSPGVERYDVAGRAGGILQRGHDHLAGFFHRRHAQRLGIVDRQAEPFGVDQVLVDFSVSQLSDHGLAAYRNLVQAFQAIDRHRATSTEALQDPDLNPDKIRMENAHQLRPCAGGVGQRTEDVEEGPHAELAPYRRGMPHRRVMG